MEAADVFDGFIDEDGKFKEEMIISGDVRGLLNLYEASYLGFPGESVMDEARSFARSHLLKIYNTTDQAMAKQLARALELPSHWRIRRSEARWHIEQYKDIEGIVDPSLLELAVLDFNMVQLVYQTDLKELNRWWKELGLPEKLEFARDRLNESFQWAVSLIQEPQFSYCRKIMSKLVCLVNVVDDVYDVYGSMDELQRFTAAILRWNAEELDELPEYMQICFMAVYNTANELAYYTIKQKGFNCLPYIKQATELERGDILKSVERYMKEKGVSEEEAREYIRWRIDQTWKRINEEIVMTTTGRILYSRLAVNLARGHHFMYHYGDANGFPTIEDKDRAMKLLYQPFSIGPMVDL
ncbi:unnamed protein product [Linum tenue]|uniref:Uncharacterized protein n=1 Tax=Linum tenue TaxID=586396 RepID=A0AAV0IFC6_9ROSI|nr:unnamed protein product [Linum tenue]